MPKSSKDQRILDIYARLCEGHTIYKSEEAQRFGVDERSIQRDIDDIRAFLDERALGHADTRAIEYDRLQKGFVMTGTEGSMMTNSEALAVSKILLDSRAFTKKELGSILDKLVEGCVPIKNMKLVSDLIKNEKFHYVELRHKAYIQDRLWQIGSDIHEHHLAELSYARANDLGEAVRRVVEPVAILFSEYYFYLNAYIVEQDASGRYIHKYDYPAIFRIDRIKNYKRMHEKFQVAYASRFEEGEFKKRIQFMYAGKLERVQLKFYGDNPEPILDRLPTAKVARQGKGECVIDAEVYGRGIIMWLLSQGSHIEVLRPQSMRDEIKRVLSDMMDLYK